MKTGTMTSWRTRSEENRSSTKCLMVCCFAVECACSRRHDGNKGWTKCLVVCSERADVCWIGRVFSVSLGRFSIPREENRSAGKLRMVLRLSGSLARGVDLPHIRDLDVPHIRNLVHYSPGYL